MNCANVRAGPSSSPRTTRTLHRAPTSHPTARRKDTGRHTELGAGPRNFECRVSTRPYSYAVSSPNVRIGVAPFREWETWYRVTGDLSSPKVPLVVAHGGPGCTHDYLLALAELAKDGRAVVHYDQLGGGRSTHLADRGADFWTVDLFLDELENLLTNLGINDRYHLLGQSWGGMLGAEHGIRQPPGLRALALSNSPASMDLWASEATKLRALLAPEIAAAL